MQGFAVLGTVAGTLVLLFAAAWLGFSEPSDSPKETSAKGMTGSLVTLADSESNSDAAAN